MRPSTESGLKIVALLGEENCGLRRPLRVRPSHDKRIEEPLQPRNQISNHITFTPQTFLLSVRTI